MHLIKKQTWIHSAAVDGLGILAWPFIILVSIILFPHYFNEHADVSPIVWILIVMGVDVSHVYSTLFRTYLDPITYKKHRSFLLLVPLVVWIAGVIFYIFGSLLFWRILAYLAVYHFIRQQYGFLKIYMRTENKNDWLYTYTIYVMYAITSIPILIWHCSPDRIFVWFVKNDFISLNFEFMVPYFKLLLALIIGVYIVFEIVESYRRKYLNIPKNVLLLGTFISWYMGIVYFNSDLIFTLFNVVSHGIPYMVLIWIYGSKKSGDTATPHWYRLLFNWKGIVLYSMVLLVFAFIEEGLWDSLIWNEHQNYFAIFKDLPSINNSILLSIIIPLLSVPQISHYIIDGYIWKLKDDRYSWKKEVLDS
ncbi:hypothetical protein [uncultured Cytophaga sp.]|uniref:hypothetical protein n=1 Tax=uncultured Cytophaga sp. TaxID=160238 RepID=UPI00262B320F|nr:hypothetical protein [uncultured Cytophaga sp.]